MVVLFFSSGAVTNKYEGKKMKQQEKSPSPQTFPHVICRGGFRLHQLGVKMF